MIRKFLSNDGAVIACCLFVALVCVLLLSSAFGPSMGRYEWQEEIYTVQPGDSLWSISLEYCPAGVDRGEWIAEVRDLNRLKSDIIRPGDDLVVLVCLGKE